MALDEPVDLLEVESKSTVLDEPMVPLPADGGIQALRDKLHARMAALRRGGRTQTEDGEAGSRDELLEERRRQRGAMRERRRKETREKIRREEEATTKKSQGKDKGKERDKGTQAKVDLPFDKLYEIPLAHKTFSLIRCSCSYRRLHHTKRLVQEQLIQMSRFLLSPVPANPCPLRLLLHRLILRKLLHNFLHGKKKQLLFLQNSARHERRAKNGQRRRLG